MESLAKHNKHNKPQKHVLQTELQQRRKKQQALIKPKKHILEIDIRIHPSKKEPPPENIVHQPM